ncbi:MAG: CerR family C-terminal domain-containing protein [Desulfobacteraceae bacterium]
MTPKNDDTVNNLNAANQTRERLLEKAEDLFAQRGYHAVSVREITAAARCNMASVNYHFSNKKNLYLEVFRSRWIPREQRIYAVFEESVDLLEKPTPELVIKALARAYLEGPLSDEEYRRHRQLIVRELYNPTEAFELAADQTLRPLFKKLYRLLEFFAPEAVDEGNLSFDILSIFGIILYFNYSRPMVSRITGKSYDADFKARLIEQMVRFSSYGLSVKGRNCPSN